MMKTTVELEANLVYSPDDGGWYADVWVAKNGKEKPSSPVFKTKQQALAWLCKHYPGANVNS